MAKTTTNYGLAVALSEADAGNIAEHIQGQGSVESKLSGAATGLLRDLAKGGVMVPSEWAARIESAIGTTDPAAIVEHVERAAGRSGDATRVEWIVDPTQLQFYKHLADNAGVSLEHQLKSLLDYAYSQGWFGMAAPDVHKLLVTPEQYRWLQQVFEQDIVTGEEVIERLHKAGVNPAVVAEDDDDLVLDSLTKG